MAELSASCILNFLLLFLLCIKNGYLTSTRPLSISYKKPTPYSQTLKAFRQCRRLGGERLLLLYIKTISWSLFCVQNPTSPYPGLLGSSCEHQTQGTSATCRQTSQIWNKMKLQPQCQPVLVFILLYDRLLLAQGDALRWALAHCFRHGGSLGWETTA